MKDSPKHIAVLTSGGDAPGMNAAIRAVVRACTYYNIKCSGIYRGYEGLIEGDFEELDARSVRNIINRGGTFLKSTRSDQFMTEEGRRSASETLKSKGVDALVVIGGNGTFIGANLLSKETNFPVVCIPATIDNDIQGTDHTIGYDTALNTVVEAIDKIRDTAHSHNRLFLVEVMGRNAGDIALNAGIGAGAEEILIPEQNMGKDRLLSSLEHSRKSGKTSSIVVVSEGKRTGENIFELAQYIESKLQNYEVRVTVLGHIQRGGSPSCYDRVLASRLGVKAVEALLDKKENIMVCVKNRHLLMVPLDEIGTDRSNIDEDLLHIADITSI